MNINITTSEFLKGLIESEQTNEGNNKLIVKNKGISYQTTKGEEEMPTIRFRKDNRYELRFYVNGIRYSIYSKDKTKLQKKYKAKLTEVKNIKKEIATSKYKLEEWFNIWLNTYKKPFVSQGTVDNIIIYFKKHILPTFGNFKLTQITIDKLQPYFNNLPIARTKELITTYFNACLKKAKDLDYIKKNPFDLIVKDKKLKNVRPAFTIFEQEKILNHIKSKDYEFYKLILFYLTTGVRRKEALTITSEDFKELILHIKGTKTKNADRKIPITQKLKDLIFKDGTIFDYKEDLVTNKFKTYLKELNIKGTLHSLRHSYATNQYYINTPAKEVQLLMGHSEINITLDIYTNIELTQDKTKMVEKIKEVYNDYYIQLKS